MAKQPIIRYTDEQKKWYVDKVEARRKELRPDGSPYTLEQAMEYVNGLKTSPLKGHKPSGGSYDKWVKRYYPDLYASRRRSMSQAKAALMGSEEWYAELPALEEKASALEEDLKHIRLEIQKRKAMQLLNSGQDIDALLNAAEKAEEA